MPRSGWLLLALLPACSTPSAMDSTVLLDEDRRVPDLVCPGAQGCENNQGPLRVGLAARSITPIVEPWEDLDEDGVRDEDEPFEDLDGDGVFTHIWMAGFGRGRAATGVHDENWVRVLVLEQDSLRLGIAVYDVVGIFHDDALAIRESVQSAGIELDHLVVIATHQHEGKDTMGLWGETPFVTGYDPEYMALLRARTVEAFTEALEGSFEAKVDLAQTTTPGLVADSRMPEVIDDQLTTLRFWDLEDKVRGYFMVWGNHPEALSSNNTLITSDFPHYLREQMESEHPGSLAIFAPGNLGGLMNPLRIPGCPDAQGEAQCHNGEFEKARYVGEGAAERALEALTQPTKLEAPRLAFRRRSMLLEPGNFGFVAGFGAGLVRRTIYGLEGRPVPQAQVDMIPLSEAFDGQLRLQTEINAVTLGPVEFLSFPGELYPELWLAGEDGQSLVEQPENADFPGAPKEPALSGFAPPGQIPVSLNQANDALGYIIPKAQFDLESPFAYRERGQYGEENSLGPQTAPSLAEAFKALYSLEP